jgi:hypothetical protein
MDFKLHPYSFASFILFLFSMTLALPAFAGGKNSLMADEATKDVTVDNDESGIEKTLEYNFSPEDRARLRKALADYAKSSDPEHDQIEQKRKAMKVNLEARFSECDKDVDGTIDREEATQCLPQIARHFSYVDVDEDELITLEELELAQAKQIEHQKAAEAKIEAQKIQDTETAIKNKSKINKQAIGTRKRPS